MALKKKKKEKQKKNISSQILSNVHKNCFIYIEMFCQLQKKHR